MEKELKEEVFDVEFDEEFDAEEENEVKVKKSIKQRLADRKQAKKADKIRVHELKADLMKNPENPEERKTELKEIRTRQLKRVVMPVAIGAGVAVTTVVAISKISSAGEKSKEDTTEALPSVESEEN